MVGNPVPPDDGVAVFNDPLIHKGDAINVQPWLGAFSLEVSGGLFPQKDNP